LVAVVVLDELQSDQIGETSEWMLRSAGVDWDVSSQGRLSLEAVAARGGLPPSAVRIHQKDGCRRRFASIRRTDAVVLGATATEDSSGLDWPTAREWRHLSRSFAEEDSGGDALDNVRA
jgi:hypothetical protein